LGEQSGSRCPAAAHECLVNAPVHGNRGDETRRVTLELDVDGGGLEIRVRDQGTGFDPTRRPDPLALENLCRSSGRGILLMTALMDAVTFCRPPRRGWSRVSASGAKWSGVPRMVLDWVSPIAARLGGGQERAVPRLA
jgi:anti-sigma regulatory factor (Ser/Thr protein kinase)